MSISTSLPSTETAFVFSQRRLFQRRDFSDGCDLLAPWLMAIIIMTMTIMIMMRRPAAVSFPLVWMVPSLGLSNLLQTKLFIVIAMTRMIMTRRMIRRMMRRRRKANLNSPALRSLPPPSALREKLLGTLVPATTVETSSSSSSSLSSSLSPSSSSFSSSLSSSPWRPLLLQMVPLSWFRSWDDSWRRATSVTWVY